MCVRSRPYWQTSMRHYRIRWPILAILVRWWLSLPNTVLNGVKDVQINLIGINKAQQDCVKFDMYFIEKLMIVIDFRQILFHISLSFIHRVLCLLWTPSVSNSYKKIVNLSLMWSFIYIFVLGFPVPDPVPVPY